MLKGVVCSIVLIALVYGFHSLAHWVFGQSFWGGMLLCAIVGGAGYLSARAYDHSERARR